MTVVAFFIIWIVCSAIGILGNIFLLGNALTTGMVSQIVIVSWIIAITVMIVMGIVKDYGKKDKE